MSVLTVHWLYSSNNLAISNDLVMAGGLAKTRDMPALHVGSGQGTIWEIVSINKNGKCLTPHSKALKHIGKFSIGARHDETLPTSNQPGITIARIMVVAVAPLNCLPDPIWLKSTEQQGSRADPWMPATTDSGSWRQSRPFLLEKRNSDEAQGIPQPGSVQRTGPQL